MRVKLLIALLLVASAVSATSKKPVVIPDKAGDFLNGSYHVGLRVTDIDAMITFLADVASLQVISRLQLPNGGERVFLSAAHGQRLELLSNPKSVKTTYTVSFTSARSVRQSGPYFD